ncbi:MAG: SCP2 sterol-binding domain-containing protein [Ilumatobacteraceae bacterium]
MSQPRVRYLSLEWIDALSAEVAASASLTELANSHEVGITPVVSGGPDGKVVYHLQVGSGRAAFGPGVADPEHVRFEQEWDTAVAVATEKLNAQQAFITGRIRLFGDQAKLQESTPVFAALDTVFGTVRGRTDYV